MIGTTVWNLLAGGRLVRLAQGKSLRALGVVCREQLIE